MNAQYRNTFKDVMAFCFYHYPRAPMVVGTYGVLFVFMSFILVQDLPKDVGVVAQIITFLIMEFVAFAFFAVLFSLSVVLGMISRRNKTILTDHKITLGDDVFCSETPYSRSEFKWTVVQKLARTKSYIFIYVAQHSAHVIPRRCVDNRAWDSFYDFCKNHKSAVPRPEKLQS